MALSEIIGKIDAYLLCLRNARDILSPPNAEGRRERAPRRKKMSTRDIAAPSSRPRIQRDGSKGSARQEALVRGRIDPVSRPPRSAVSPTAKVPEQATIALTASAPQQAAGRAVSSSSREKPQSIPVRARAARKTMTSKPAKVIPAIALAGSNPARIVVVSAEEVRSSRERAAESKIVQHPVPASRLTGRGAFDALFRDDTDSSKTRE